MKTDYRFCPLCAAPLQWRAEAEDGGTVERLRCTRCHFVHWNNPTPVLAAVIELDGKVLLARNAAWPGRMFALITGFMEAGETPQDGIRREIAEETALHTESLELLGVWDFQRMNQLIVAYAARCTGEVKLSPELAEYKLMEPERVKCWPGGTGQAMAHWLRQRGIEPTFIDPWANTRS